MKKVLLSKSLPLMLLGGLLLAGLITIFLQADTYGISRDEPIQDRYGQAVMAWYQTLGKDTSFLTAFPSDAYMPEHGGFFDAIIAAVQHAFPPADHWQVRQIITALCGLVGIVAIALCGYELGGYWMAFLAALGLWLYPRYYGAIYNDPKDIPAAVTMTFLLWAALLLIKQWDQRKRFIRNSLLVGFCIGLAASIRVNAVIWYVILALLPIAWWVLHGKRVWQEKSVRAELVKQGIAASVIGITSLLTMMALWPYIFLSPLVNLFHSIKILSQYPWNGPVLYDGIVYGAMQLPRTYAPKWLLIASPPTLVSFALLGVGIACALSIKKGLIDPKIALVMLSFIIPLGALVDLHAVVYDGLRQFLFLVPPMILIAVYGLVQTVTYLAHKQQKIVRWAAAGLVTVTLASYVPVVKEMVDLSPFEYSYFSPVIGGISGANGKFDTDYWATCSKPASEWLAQNYQHYTSKSAPTLEGQPSLAQMLPYLPTAFHEDDAHPDFYIASTRDNYDQGFPTYTVIHIVAAEGVPFCVVKVNPAVVRAS
jgi:hypothetical protein